MVHSVIWSAPTLYTKPCIHELHSAPHLHRYSQEALELEPQSDP